MASMRPGPGTSAASSSSAAPVVGAHDWRRLIGSGSALTQRLGHILNTGKFSDASLIVGNESREFKVHQVILRTGSKVFDDLFNAHPGETRFQFPDTSTRECKFLLQYLYTGDVTEAETASVSALLEYLRIAAKFGILELVGMCGDIIGKRLTEHNIVKIYHQVIKYGDAGLKEVTLKAICKYGYQVISSGRFMEFSAEQLRAILARDDFAVPDESLLFEALVKWGQAICQCDDPLGDGTQLRTILEQDGLLSLIRFPTMDTTDFTLKVASTGILQTNEIVSIMMRKNVANVYRSNIPLSAFNGTPRVPYVPKGQELVLIRLTKFGGRMPFMDLSTDEIIEQPHIPHTDLEQCIKFKPSMPIWITSVGVNSTYSPLKASWLYSSDIISVLVEIKDVNQQLIAAETEHILQVRKRTSDVYHVRFQPVYLRRDQWYSISYRTVSGKFFANKYMDAREDTTIGYRLTGGGYNEFVKFEFQNADNPQYTGVSQGFIPEIGLMIE